MGKVKSIKNLPLASLLLLVASLLIISAVIDPAVTASLVGGVVIIIKIATGSRPEIKQQFLSKWGSITDIVHWGIITFAIVISTYIIVFFIKNYEIKIISKKR
ncbi:MAG: hypothetical protein WCT22_04190 [Patescibacteria group bacterium]|jgi:hypothetical protein